MADKMSNTTISINTGHTVDGTVVHGDKRGRLLGFPTANVDGEAVAVRDGVWAGTVRLDLDGPIVPAAISLGRRPTYYAETGVRLIEAFLLDFDEQIYERRVRIEFREYLRAQWSFDDSSQLVDQLHQDVADVRTWAVQHDLLATEANRPAKPRGGWGPTKRKLRRDKKERGQARDARRAELVSQAILACPPDMVSHEWVSSWTGLPVGFLLHTYPTLEALRAAAPDGSH